MSTINRRIEVHKERLYELRIIEDALIVKLNAIRGKQDFHITAISNLLSKLPLENRNNKKIFIN